MHMAEMQRNKVANFSRINKTLRFGCYNCHNAMLQQAQFEATNMMTYFFMNNEE